MSKLIMFDFACPNGHVFEDLAQPDAYELPCSTCGEPAKRQVSGTHLDPKMGVTNDFPTAAAKWAKKQRQRAKKDNIGGPNLWMY